MGLQNQRHHVPGSSIMPLRWEMDELKKGDLVKFKDPLDENEKRERFVLLEDPDGGRVLAEGVCDLLFKPTRVLKVDELSLAKLNRTSVED
jgi:hypothetical protein